MSIPEQSATQKDIDSSENSNTPSLEEQLAISEKRRKDTVSSFTKGQQKIKSQEAIINKLTEQLEEHTQVNISKEDQDELDDLKFNNPVAWRDKLNALETKHKSESRAKLAELSSEASGAAEQLFELDRRKQVLQEFNDSAEIAITDEVIANDVPPRITNKLADNKVTFEEFLDEVSKYLSTVKVVKNDKTLNQPNMGDMAGGTKPSNTKPGKSLSENYSGDIY